MKLTLFIILFAILNLFAENRLESNVLMAIDLELYTSNRIKLNFDLYSIPDSTYWENEKIRYRTRYFDMLIFNKNNDNRYSFDFLYTWLSFICGFSGGQKYLMKPFFMLTNGTYEIKLNKYFYTFYTSAIHPFLGRNYGIIYETSGGLIFNNKYRLQISPYFMIGSFKYYNDLSYGLSIAGGFSR